MNSKAELEVRCSRCGTVRVDTEKVRCGIDPGGVALCEMGCPACAAPIFLRVATGVAVAIFWLGGKEDLHAPLELLEPHRGAALSWDDVLDMHLALAAMEGAPDRGSR
jgi:hypothetical protein